MHDAREAEDRRLLENGEHQQLVEGYYGVIVERCQARVPAQDALDVAANVVLRLLDELKRGKTYPGTPYRVVVHMVIGWKIKEHFAPDRWRDAELDERLMRELPLEGLEDDLDFALDLPWLLDGLAERERQVAELRIGEELSPAEIAERLGITRNNVDQAWNRAKSRLRERLTA